MMENLIDAYEALVVNLRGEIHELIQESDERASVNATIIHALFDCIVIHGGLTSALDAAEKLDKQFPDEKLVDYVNDIFGGP